jgi:polyhydroxyalkanoate synthesis regulator protein
VSTEEIDVKSPDTSDMYDPWESVIQKAFEKCQEQFEEEVQKLLSKSNRNETEVKKQVYEDMKSVYRKAVSSVFTNRMMWFNAIQKDSLYKAIKKTANQLMELDDYGKEEAWKYAVSKRKYIFDDLLEQFAPPEMNREIEPAEEEEEEDITSEPVHKKHKV